MWARNILCGIGLACLCAAALPPLAVQAAERSAGAAQARQGLELASTSALVVDLQSGREVYASHADVVLPIASITKLMTAIVVLDARLPLDEVIPVTIRDTRELQGVFSRVRVNSQLSRRELLRLALMSSENRAASALAHHYPGGHAAFVAAMNAKARALGMRKSRFTEPTGLSSGNVSTARELVQLLQAAQQYPLIREMSTTPNRDAHFRKPNYALSFFNTNPLVRKGDWSIQVSKTGFTNDAGHCLVMLTRLDGHPTAVVLLDSFGKYTRIADANRLRRWMESGQSAPIPDAARRYKQQKVQQFRQMQAARSDG
ncbi:D-alanyl-D-alanine endopeptidase [Geopseudomonas guangdongensis]|uniref:Murein-DD-endopeptidase. Serine peptidase. MEROPS family S11 n=1 Tax=Geopseudomonas guangdongensis TaxID=1245526 RepID=A0A1H2F8X5_9GAMM|nr:D-alanyl-D-alanine endopeptidase [Pseudomonas guangdongensis]SDU03850.1 murein-DD-endopeptidase. Serine peptidase. MEROPS family S11 [Pseudomonas guangdongensis]